MVPCIVSLRAMAFPSFESKLYPARNLLQWLCRARIGSATRARLNAPGKPRVEARERVFKLLHPFQQRQHQSKSVRRELEIVTQARRSPRGDDAARAEAPLRCVGVDRFERAELDELAKLRFGHSGALRKLDEADFAALVQPKRFSELDLHSRPPSGLHARRKTTLSRALRRAPS